MMNEFEWQTILTSIGTMIAGGGLGGLLTARYTRKQAKNEAEKGVQEIYQQMIDNLMEDRNFYQAQTEQLREQIAELNRKVDRLETEVRENRKTMKEWQPNLCSRQNCTQRIYMSQKKPIRKNADNRPTPPQNRAES